MGKQIISRHIYGHFAEHLGRCIYGGFYLKENTDIPHVRRIRQDVVQALREINIPNLRWPGGCFADEYHWQDGIGPQKERPGMINTHWGGVTEDNSFGTHEFMDLCQQLGCEPVICGNIGSGTVREMSQWVEYLTSSNISPMTNLRKKNGREKPWKVKFWGLGNENWACGGNMTPEYYANLMRRFSTYCRNYPGNRLYKIACGPYSDNTHWMEVLLKEPKNRYMFQGISLHYYTDTWDMKNKSATEFSESEWIKILQKARKMDEIINKQKIIMDKYDPQNKIGLIVDEWGTWYKVEPGTNPGFLYQQNSLRDAVAAGVTLNILNSHCDRVKMANIAQTINVLQAMILTKDDKLVLTPTYYVFKLYRVHHDATLLPASLNCEDYRFNDVTIPAISASASRDAEGFIHITLCHLNPNKEIRLTCELRGISKIKLIDSQIITAPRINSCNDFGKKEQVNIKSFKQVTLKGNTLSLNMPAKSIIMIKLKS